MRQALGKGLEALIPGGTAQENKTTAASGIQKVSIQKIKPNHKQPRKLFSDAALKEMSNSIKQHGVAQPIVLTVDSEGGYELVAGERRLRASKLAGLTEIPAVVRESMDERTRLTLALIENVQREDLNAVEQAQAYQELIEEFGLTQVQLSQAVGKSRPSIANTLRLLDLSEKVQGEILSGRLSEGHGRALLAVKDSRRRDMLAERAVLLNMSVRNLEAAAAKVGRKTSVKKEPFQPIEIKNLETDLQRHFGTKVSIRCSKKGVGMMKIEFYSFEDLERVAHVIK